MPCDEFLIEEKVVTVSLKLSVALYYKFMTFLS